MCVSSSLRGAQTWEDAGAGWQASKVEIWQRVPRFPAPDRSDLAAKYVCICVYIYMI